MTADEYREAIAALGLTQARAAKLFERNERTSRRWATGETDIPDNVAYALRIMVRYRRGFLDVPADGERS